MKLFLFSILFSLSVFANHYPPEKWGIGLGQRNASIPYTAKDDRVIDIVPLFYYKSDYLELDEFSASLTYYINNNWKANLLAKYRFFDIPSDFQNEVQNSGFDYGLETKYQHNSFWETKAQLLVDGSRRPYLNLETSLDKLWKIISYRPYAYFTLRSSEFNNHYYGTETHKPGLGFEVGAGIKSSIHVYENLSILAQLKISSLDGRTSDSSYINGSINTETLVGFAFSDDKAYSKQHESDESLTKLKSKEYVRVGYAQATPSNLNAISGFHTATDKYNNDMISIAYGLPLSDTLFGTNSPVYLQPIYVRHLESSVQDPINEYVLSFKTFITFKWPINWRIGLAEGVSYVDDLTYIEGIEIEAKGYRDSKLMNFIDLNFDFSLDKIGLSDTWAGLMIHHRSAIFESSSIFGRIKGGSNYIGFYLQYHY